MPLTISLLTMVNQDDTIINSTNFPLPEDLSHEILDPLLLAETAELEILYPEPNTLKTVIKAWALARQSSWTRMLEALDAEYDPISNYDRTESWTDTHNLTNSREFHGTNSGSINGNGATVSSGSGTDTGTVAGYNSTDWANKDKMTRSDSSNIQSSNTQSSSGANDYADTNRDTGTLTRAGRVSGNIGVMTSQQMVTAEIELRSVMDMYQIIVREFTKRFCLGVY